MTTHTLSIERVDWPKLYMTDFKVRAATFRQRQFPVIASALYLSVTNVCLRCCCSYRKHVRIIKANHILFTCEFVLMAMEKLRSHWSARAFSPPHSKELTHRQDRFYSVTTRCAVSDGSVESMPTFGFRRYLVSRKWRLGPYRFSNLLLGTWRRRGPGHQQQYYWYILQEHFGFIYRWIKVP